MSEKKVDTRRTITLRLTPEEHKSLKMYCVEHDEKMQEWIVGLIRNEIGFKESGGMG